MPLDSESVECSECGILLGELANDTNRLPCPECGSMKRTIHLQLSDTIDHPVVEMIDMKVKKPSLTGSRKLRLHIKSGQELSRRLGRYVNKERVLDKDNDQYLEIVTDPLTGEVLHHCDEPLSKHQGHGSAKFISAKATE